MKSSARYIICAADNHAGDGTYLKKEREMKKDTLLYKSKYPEDTVSAEMLAGPGSKTVIRLTLGDITHITDVDAIVNAANNTLLGGGGVDGAIHRAAGPGLYTECSMLNGCPTGEAKITKAYSLPCDYVIHTVGPIWRGGSGDEENLLKSCYRHSLMLAEENNIKKIAFPSISTGIYGYPIDLAAQTAIGEVITYVNKSPSAFTLIEWVLFDTETFKAYDEALTQAWTSLNG